MQCVTTDTVNLPFKECTIWTKMWELAMLFSLSPLVFNSGKIGKICVINWKKKNYFTLGMNAAGWEPCNVWNNYQK